MKRAKVFVCIGMLGLALALIVSAVFAAPPKSGVVNGISWTIICDDLEYDSASQCTGSFHLYDIDNGSGFKVSTNFEFAHRVVNEFSNVVAWAVINQNGPTLDPGEDDSNWWWFLVDVDDLDAGNYTIDAYTRLSIYKVQGGQLTFLAEPQVNDDFDFTKED